MNGWQDIVAIVDAAAPLVISESASEASVETNVARRKPRGRSSSSRTSDDATQDPAAPLSPSAAVSPGKQESASSRSGSKSGENRGAGARGGSSGGGRGDDDGAPPPEESPEAMHLRLAFLRQTDLGNVFRFVERNRGKLLYNESLPGISTQGGGWLWWDGRRWAHAGADARVRIAEHDCVQAIGDEAKACLAEAERLAKRHSDIVEPAPAKKRKRKSDDDNVIKVDFRARKKAEQQAPSPDGDGGDIETPSPPRGEGAETKGGDAEKEKRDAGKIAARITTLYRLAVALNSWARKSEANSKMTPIARHAAAYLRVDLGELDADRLAFNVQNGTLIFRREWSPTFADENGVPANADPAIAGHEQWTTHGAYIKFKPHDPADRITKLAPVAFDPQAGCERFLTFLGEVQRDGAMRAFLQAWKGYQLTGETGEARMCIFHGKGRNGKGVFEDATGHVLGDYGGSSPVQTFLIEGQHRGAGQATPELAKLPGIRSLRTSEPKKDAKLDEALIKLCTGGDPIDARHLNRPYFTFVPEFKLTMLTNHQPKIFGVDEGIWARVTLVPWSVIVPPEKRDPQLAFKLRAEASGILNWMLDGLSVFLERGLALPDEVKRATADYRSESDPLGQFLAACVVEAPGDKVQATPFHELFCAWCRGNAGPEWSARGLAQAMHGRGFRSTKISVMYWLDIRVTKTVADFGPQGGGAGGTPPPADRRDGSDDMVF